LEARYAVHFLYWKRDKYNAEDYFDSDLYGKSNFKVESYIFPFSHFSFLSILTLPVMYLRLFLKLRSFRWDIVHITHILFLAPAVFLTRIRGKKFIYDVFEFYYLNAKTKLPYFLNWLGDVLHYFECILAKQAVAIFTIDSRQEKLKRDYERFNKNVNVIYNVPRKNYITEVKRFQFDLKEKIMIYIGGINEQKGINKAVESLLKIRKRYTDVRLLLIGKIEENYKKILTDSIRKNSLEHAVEIKEWMSFGETISYLETAYVGLALHQPTNMIYRYVSRGNASKFFAYMQAGIPTVGSNRHEIAKVIEEEEAGILVDTTNTEEIVKAIEKLFGNSKMALEMAKNGMRAVRKKYNWENEKQKIIKAYEKVQ